MDCLSEVVGLVLTLAALYGFYRLYLYQKSKKKSGGGGGKSGPDQEIK